MDDHGILADMDGNEAARHQDETVVEGHAVPDAEQVAARTADARLAAAHQALADAGEALRAAREKEGECDADEAGTRWQRAAATETAAKAQRVLEQAMALVETLAREDADARERVAAAEAAARPAQVATAPPPATVVPGEGEPRLVYGSAEEFLHEQLLPLYNRIVDGKNGKWCPRWYLHPEAVSRIEALWRAWEHLRLDAATGMSVWWRDHADPHMGVLFNTKGPFHACSSTTHYTPDQIVCEYAPVGWFPDERENHAH